MRESRDPYWHDDLLLTEAASIRGTPRTVRLQLHHSTERYHQQSELFPLMTIRGERDYFHGKPYLLVPDVTVTVGLYPRSGSGDAIGEVIGSGWQGMRH